MKQKNTIAIVLLFLLFLGFGVAAHAQTPRTQDSPIVDVNFHCPGCQKDVPDIGAYLNNLYKFSLWIGGALALGMIVAGGIMRIVSAGSPDKQREASDMITSSIFGLILLFGSYLILNTINPKITLLKLPAAGESEAKLAPQSADNLTSNDCVGKNTQTFETIRVFDGSAQISDLSCLYRRSIIKGDHQLIVGDYYNDNPIIKDGSMVWLYPYFTKSGGSSSAECLIYAYLEPKSSSNLKPGVKIVELNSNLQLCTPKMQSLDSPTCKEWTFNALKSSGAPQDKKFDFLTNGNFSYITDLKINVTGSTFNYSDPNSPPNITSGYGVTGTMFGDDKPILYCVDQNGIDKNSTCVQWGDKSPLVCSVVEKPKIQIPSNNVVINACNTCEDIPSNFAVNAKPCDKTANNSNLNTTGNCRLNKDLIQKLTAFSDAKVFGSGWQINEAWPATVYHHDPCHADGTCADIGLSDASCPNVVKALAALKKVGLGGSGNEYAACGGTTYDTTTGNHIHVK